jgi:hypothetical protein
MELFLGLCLLIGALIHEKIQIHRADKYAREQLAIWKEMQKYKSKK